MSRLTIGDPAPNILLLDANGQTVAMKDQWSNGPTLVTFLRHFG
jgi:peroxiredoxin